ncbi:MAG: hypothetical protein DRH26_01160 [Deltaproteobacteria bacterium]|nr:MAG: hypothetical protein DRH26_01160 [Deltaproteobacteria bacterium]
MAIVFSLNESSWTATAKMNAPTRCEAPHSRRASACQENIRCFSEFGIILKKLKNYYFFVKFSEFLQKKHCYFAQFLFQYFFS